jgi:predicted dehydrogenase
VRFGGDGGSALRILVCGCGAVTERFYLPALQELERDGRIRIDGVVDPNRHRAAQIGGQFRTSREYAELEPGLTDVQPDLVIVASPHQFHKEHALAGLRAGSHVLCEKPLALSPEDCDVMIETAEHEGRLLAVGHFRRFFPSVQAIRSIVRAELMGRPVSFEAFEGDIYRWPLAWSGSYRRADVGGGVLADLGPHTLDLLAWWLGDLRLVGYSDDAVDGIETNCRADLETDSGVRGTLRLSRDTELPDRHVLTFERGWIGYKCDVPDQFEWGWDGASHSHRVLLGTRPPESPMWAMGFGPVSPHPASSFAAQLRNVLAAIEGEETLVASAADARAGIALIEECYTRKRLSDMPWLDQEERQEAQARFEESK